MGQFNTEEGLITVADIPLLLSSGPSLTDGSGQLSGGANGLLPPSGMVPFEDHSGSQENEISDHFSLSYDRVTNGNEDLLIIGSLSEIGTNERDPRWTVGEVAGSSVDSLQQLHQLGEVPSDHHESEASADEDSVDEKWYHDDDEDYSNEAPEVRSQPMEVHKSEGESSSMAALDELSQGSERQSHITPMGPIKIKKKGRKSLEALTRISSDKEPITVSYEMM